MRGFLLQCARRPCTPSGPGPTPFDGDTPVEKRNISPNIQLLTWGNNAGDIHTAGKQDLSLLVLSGYIAQAPMIPDCSDQQRVCEQLRTHLDNNPSTQTIQTCAENFHGSFALLYINLRERTLWCCSDRTSSRQLWLHTGDNGLSISSHAVALARHAGAGELAPGPLASYLLYATQVDPGRSFFKHVNCLREGTIGRYKIADAITADRETTWYRFQHQPDMHRPTSSWVRLTTDCFRRAAERLLQTTGKPLLFLSGGVDSRLAGAALVAAGGAPLCCTLGDSMNLEIKVARAVARALNCPLEIILRDDEWYLRTLSNAMFSANGVFSWNHSHFSAAYNRLRKSHSIDSAILGDFCEAFSKICFSIPAGIKTLWSTKEFLTCFDQLPLPNYRPVARAQTLSLLHHDFRATAEVELRHAIVQRYEQVRTVSDEPLIVGDYFFRWQTASSIATFQMFNDLRSAGPERNLMFDRELQQLLEIMPAAVRCRKNLGARVINRLCPPAARVANANSLLPLLLPRQAHKLAQKARPKLGKIRRRLFADTYKTTGSWPHLPLLYAGHPQWKARIEERLFDNSLLPRYIFNKRAVEQCWQSFCKGDLQRHCDVERLLGLAEVMHLL